MMNDDEQRDVLIVIALPKYYPIVMRALNRFDSETGLFFRVDPENTGARTHRHILIWKGKKKGKGVAWNLDGSRHDKHSFNTKLEGFEQAKELAKRILKPKPGTTFDLLKDEHYLRLCDEVAKAIIEVSTKDTRGKIIFINYDML